MTTDRKLCLSILVASAMTLVTGGCTPDNGYISTDGLAWNTTYHIVYRGSGSLADSVQTVLDEVGSSLSVFDPASVVSAVNSSADGADVDRHFERVYRTAEDISRRSAGAFDPTLSPVITAWGFGPGHKATADTARIDTLLAFCGLDKTRLEGRHLHKSDRRTQFNFSAVAKGYGCDMVGAMLRRNGVCDYLVEIGGEIVASGRSPRGDKWIVSVDRPLSSDDGIPSHESQVLLSITDCGMATSGNYRNYHGSGKARYGHTIDPATGRPALTDVLSTTVVARDCMTADALATACMAMGSKAARHMARRDSLAIMLVLADSSVVMTPQFHRHISATSTSR